MRTWRSLAKSPLGHRGGREHCRVRKKGMRDGDPKPGKWALGELGDDNTLSSGHKP